MRILRLAEVIKITGLRKTLVYELQAAGTFPMKVQLTPRSVGWVENEVQTWLAGKLAARSLALNREHIPPSSEHSPSESGRPRSPF
ncbi:MAG: AlpA family phage regulatory protein [Proteobacteria bacterium]|nr:AlpA family phage regulatory protein [Pseudomonadota bacterium]